MLKEKRDRTYTTLPLSNSKIAGARIIFLLSPLILIQLINVLTINLGTLFTDHDLVSIYAMQFTDIGRAGFMVTLMAVLIILVDIYFSMDKSDKKLRILLSVCTGIFLIAIGTFFHLFSQSLINTMAEANNFENRYYIGFVVFLFPLSFVIFGVLLGFVSVKLFKNRKSYV